MPKQRIHTAKRYYNNNGLGKEKKTINQILVWPATLTSK